jgi:Cu+-exporting ATPase
MGAGTGRRRRMRTVRITLPIYNLSCGGGGSLTIERILAKSQGVVYAYVNPATEMAYLEYDPALTDREQLTAIIERAGFGSPRRETHGERHADSRR